MEKVRLNKYIAMCGVAGRRKADELIKNGNVRLNGKAVRELGIMVGEADKVELNGRLLQLENKKIYMVLNKPKGYITSLKDDRERPVVMDLIGDIQERIYPVGRLDYNTTGLLILTNDGELANGLTHPSRRIYKTYHAKIRGELDDSKLKMLRSGVDIGGFITSESEVKIIKHSGTAYSVEIKIYEGRNRQVRKMFNAVGCKVMELERVAIGEIVLGRLKPGHYRKLTRDEVAYLKEITNP